MKFLWSLVFLGFGWNVAAAEEANCFQQPGRRLCLNMRQAQSYIVSCEGDQCYRLWSQYIQALDKMTEYALDHFVPGDTFDIQVGELARKLAVAICEVRHTGAADWIGRLTIAENRALETLKQIQFDAGSEQPRFCEKVAS